MGVSLGLHAAELLIDLPVFDHEGAALDAHDFLAIHILLFHNFKGVGEFLFAVGEKCEGEIELGLELLQRGGLVGRNANDDGAGLFELLMCVAKLGRLDVSTGSIGLGKEVQDEGFAMKILQRTRISILVGQIEIGGFIMGWHI